MYLDIPDKINLYDVMRTRAKKNPKKIIIEDAESSLTYENFLLNVNVLSQKIKENTKNEERIGVFLPNVVAQVVVLFSIFKNEQDPCILNFTMDTSSLNDCVKVASLKTVLTSRKFIKTAKLEAVIEEMEKQVSIVYLEDLKDAIAINHKLIGFMGAKMLGFKKRKQRNVILFTSGTESQPKGVVLTHRNVYANIQQAMSIYDITENDRIFNPLPLFHSFGITVGAVLPLIENVKGFVYPSPLHFKEIPKMIEKDRSTVMVATNTFFDNYEKHAEENQFESLRYVIAGAEKLKEDVKEKYKSRFGIEILEGYGATETSPIIALNSPEFKKEGSVGKILPEMEYKIEKIEGLEKGGNLLVKGPNVMSGYLINNQGFVKQEGWYNTGDIVEVDEEGYIFIVSRLKRFSKIAGEMISLSKVEDYAFECFKDSRFYAVSTPDKRKGEKIILFTENQDATEKELKKFIKAKKVSSLYIPFKIEHITEVPILGSGKTNYRKLEDYAKSVKKGIFG